jgi:hypothetical protein
MKVRQIIWIDPTINDVLDRFAKYFATVPNTACKWLVSCTLLDNWREVKEVSICHICKLDLVDQSRLADHYRHAHNIKWNPIIDRKELELMLQEFFNRRQ